MKKGIDNNGDERFYSFLTIDMPIYNKQVETLLEEMQQHFNHESTGDLDRWAWDTCVNVDHDGYGSFRFEWPAEVMNFLTEDQRQQMEDILNEVAGGTDILCHLMQLSGYQDGDIEIEDASDVEYYIDSIIDAGYSVGQDDADYVPDHLQDAFNTYYASLKITEEVA